MIRIAGLCALALAALAIPAHAASARVEVWASSADGARKLARQADLVADAAGADGETITLDPAPRGSPVVGYGAAMTDASAHVLQGLPAAEREALLAELFGPRAAKAGRGLGLNFLRVPIGASDFSARHYSLDDVPAGQRDPALAQFSMAGPDAAQVPMLRAVRRADPGLVLMASPWSAPGWMKDSGSLIKGHLLPAAYPAYAAYFSRYLDAMAVRGLPVRYLSVQNEPRFEPDNYPGMRFDAAERAAFIGDALGPALAHRRTQTAILDWDHNWDHPEEPLGVLADARAAKYVSGVAWHCYGGEPAAMARVKAAHPGKDLFLTECSGGEWAPKWGETLGWMIDNLLIAPSAAGSRGTLLWNLALDQSHGPHLGGCGDCRGVITVDRQAHTITRNVEYYALGHLSRFVRAGARLIGSSGGGAVRQVAFRNRDGSMVLLAHNGGAKAVRLAVAARRWVWRLVLPPGEVVTLVWRR